MKFLLALALAGLSLAQETTSTVQSTMVMTAVVSHDGPAPSSTPTAQQTCLAACAAGDVNCQAICVGVPHPSNSDMNSTTSCVAACDQGDGSKGATDAYATCRNNCISSYILLGTAKPAGASGSAASGSAGAAAATTTGAAGKNGTAAATGSSTSVAFAAPTMAARFGAAGGSLGLVLAAFALL